MCKQELFELYGKVLKGDKQAIETLIAEHKKVFKNNHNTHAQYLSINKKDALHRMYLHLTR